MKKIIYLIWAIGAVGITACGDSSTDYVAATTLNITESDVDFHSIGGEGSITLGDGNAEIQAESNSDWCSITGTSGNVISFSVLPNEDMQTRTATVYITTNQAKGQVSVTQSGFIVNYDLNDFYSYADNIDFTRRVEFVSELPVTSSVDQNAADWLSCEKTTGGYMVTAGENKTGNARLGQVTIQTGSIAKTYTFLQYGKEDLCKEWNATFINSTGDAAANTFSIEKTDGDNLTINMTVYEYKNIKAYYEAGAIKIPCGQYMKDTDTYKLYLGVLGAAGGTGIAPSVTYQLKPYYMGEAQWGLKLVDDGSFEEPISALATWAYKKDKDKDKEPVGYWDVFYDLSLSF